MLPICYMLVGLPGCGKTTAAEKLLKENPELTTVSTDQYIEEIAKKKNKTYAQVYREVGDDATKWMNRQIAHLIKDKKSFIWDQTNVYQSARIKKNKFLKQNKYEVIAIVVELSDEELNRRIAKRAEEGGKKIGYKIMQEMIKNYTRPAYYEGFKEIFIINDQQEQILLPNNIDNNSFNNKIG